MVTRATGLRYPDQGKLARRAHLGEHAAFRGSLGEPKGEAYLTECAQLNQRETSTCHAHAVAVILWANLAAAGKRLAWVPSPLILAGATYVAEQGPASTRGPLQDTGADLSDDVHAVGVWGLAPMIATWTLDGLSDMPDDTSVSFPELDPSRLVVAGETLVTGGYSIPVDDNAGLLVALALDRGIGSAFGGPVNGAYQAMQAGQIATSAMATGNNGHAQGFVAYRTVNGRRQYKIRGSWGLSFGEAGAVWCDDSFLSSLWAIWPLPAVVS